MFLHVILSFCRPVPGPFVQIPIGNLDVNTTIHESSISDTQINKKGFKSVLLNNFSLYVMGSVGAI